MHAYRISQVYDIAESFITDKATQMVAEKKYYGFKYTFTKKISKDTTYTLAIHLPVGQVIKPEPGVRDWEVNYQLGKLSLMSDDKHLVFAQTRHSVGKAGLNTTSDLQKAFIRLKSRKFFDLIDMSNKRLRGELNLRDNSAEIFNVVYRLSQLQK